MTDGTGPSDIDRPEAARSALDDAVAAVALLDEPNRRRLYEYVTSRPAAVGRDEAAAALGIGRELAAFHLDRLARAGILDTEFRRIGVRRGPGAGRPSKLYRRSDREVSVSLPGRDYKSAAEVFAEALDRLPGDATQQAVEEVARERGRAMGAAARRKAGRRPGKRSLRAGLTELLGEAGYEPTREPASGAIRLQNCPYHALTAAHRDLTCGMNLAWGEGVLEGLGGSGLGAELAPEPGYCCVVFREAPTG
jgi:predicted ArsR family transcriptional regulator